MPSSSGSSYLSKHQKLITRRHSVRSQKTWKSFSFYCLRTAFKMNVLPVATAMSSSVTKTLLKHDRQCTYNVVFRRVRVTTFDVEKSQVLHILSVCLQPQLSSMKCAIVILSSVTRPALQNCTTLSHKRHDFRIKKKLLNTKCVFLVFSVTFVCNISYSKKSSASYNPKYILRFM